MTPKEKASELVDRYNLLQTFIVGFGYQHAKECATIAVDEILQNFGNKLDGKPFYSACHAVEFYQQVKQEIQNL
jgi:Mn-dependent DtxR family transcriptional regulator